MNIKVIIIPFIFTHIAIAGFQSIHTAHLDFLKRMHDLRGDHAGLLAARPLTKCATTPSLQQKALVKTSKDNTTLAAIIEKCTKQEA